MKAFQNYSFIISFLLVITPKQSLGASQKNATVVFYLPTSQGMVSADNLEIIVEFDSPIDPGSIDSRSFSIFGRWTGVCQGNYIFENNNQRTRFSPTTNISAGEWVTVSLSKEIRTDSGENLRRDKVAARKHLQTALDLEPEHPKSKRLLKKLQLDKKHFIHTKNEAVTLGT